jgi:hypothetical protein
MRALALLCLAACATPAHELRFRNQPPVWRVDDRKPLAARPSTRIYNRTLYHTDGFFIRRATRALELGPRRRAADTSSLDEVPDSTWFTNRIGVRDLSIAELRRGPNRAPSPFDRRPWTIRSLKTGGMSLGFVVEDARGDRYLLKFDDKRRPEMETAAHVIVHRILWACGYNVPEDHLGYIRRDELVVGARAKARGITDAVVDHKLEGVYRTTDGRIRVLASRWLPGTPIGPYAREGTRPDDPNDKIPHERRRSLRGQYAIFSWLDHADIQEDNTLDVFVDGHVEHYLIDFGKALGVMAHDMGWKTVGHTYRLDLEKAFSTLLTLGMTKLPWDDRPVPGLRGIGLYDASSFDPGRWRANSPYWPFEDADRFDGLWGAKLAMRFSRAQLAAIVDEAQLSDPRAAAYMVDTLVERQRKTARYWFARTAPLDRFRLDAGRLCFTDLARAYGLDDASTHYTIDVFDGDRPTGYHRTALPTGTGDACAPDVIVNGYTIARIRTDREARALPPVFVHLARDAAGRPGIIGLWRE